MEAPSSWVDGSAVGEGGPAPNTGERGGGRSLRGATSGAPAGRAGGGGSTGMDLTPGPATLGRERGGGRVRRAYGSTLGPWLTIHTARRAFARGEHSTAGGRAPGDGSGQVRSAEGRYGRGCVGDGRHGETDSRDVARTVMGASRGPHRPVLPCIRPTHSTLLVYPLYPSASRAFRKRCHSLTSAATGTSTPSSSARLS